MAVPVESSAATFTGGIPTRIFDAKNYSRSLFAYDVQPDGQRFLMLRACNKTHHDDDLDALHRTALTSAVYGRRAVARHAVESH